MHTSQFSVAILTFLLSVTICPLILFFSRKYQSQHNETVFRQVHESYTPRLGGIAIFLSFFISMNLMFLFNTGLATNFFFKEETVFWFLGVCSLIFLVGLADDFFSMRARYKLLLEIVIASLTVYFFFQIQLIHIPFLGVIDLGFLSIPFSILWIVGVINAVNLIDGLDGLASGTAIIALIGIVVTAFIAEKYLFSALGISVIAAILGFLVFNHYPAKIFMGDSGSFFLGYFLAILSMLSTKESEEVFSFTLPVILLGLPIADTLFSMLRRTLRGIPFFSADKHHIHHKLLAKGLSHLQTVYFLHFISLLFLTLFFLVWGNLVNVRLGIIMFFGVCYLLIFYSGYREVSSPISFIRSRKNSKRERTFSMELSQNIEVFYKNATTIKEVFFIFSVWAEQVSAISSEILFNNDRLVNDSDHLLSSEKKALKQLTFSEKSVTITLYFKPGFLELDSDVRFKNIHKVVAKTFHYLLLLDPTLFNGDPGNEKIKEV